MVAFKGVPPGGGAGEMSRRTEVLRPAIQLTPQQVAQARRLRRAGHQPEQIAATLQAPLDEVEKALVQMRSPRPETTRGTLNVTLAAHRLIMQERRGDEPVWQTIDRLLGELLELRASRTAAAERVPVPARSRRSGAGASAAQSPLPLLDRGP